MYAKRAYGTTQIHMRKEGSLLIFDFVFHFFKQAKEKKRNGEDEKEMCMMEVT
jgi:hypothetical protein